MMGRSWVVALLVCAAVSGCGADANYEVAWTLGAETFSARDCGYHGVSEIVLEGFSDGGDTHLNRGPCGAGVLRGSLSAGMWELTVRGADIDGIPKEPADSLLLTAHVTAPLSEGDNPRIVVALEPQPECRDGVDNDADGAVDLADPGCAQNPEGATE